MGTEVIGPAVGGSVHVMSFNVRVAGSEPPHSWAERRGEVAAVLNAEQPSLLGIQEGLFDQVRDISADLIQNYEWIGLGRGGGSRGEFTAIFFDADRLDPLAYDHLWLSDSPYLIASTTWGNRITRMLTWVQFADRRTGLEFIQLNTHLDHASAPARHAGAELIRSTLQEFSGGVPVILTGDFNARPSSEIYRILVEEAGLVDTWLSAERQTTPAYVSFTGWNDPVEGEKRIDWILVSPGIAVDQAAINPCTGASTYPSDHLPVQASVTLPPTPSA